jgi:hypothetical protein
MELPSEFSFSQQNLQDFLDCPRRFELRHVNKLAWPAVRSEPVLELERHMRLGERFHQMVQQHQLGLPEEIIANQTTEVELDQWWKSYLLHPPTPLPDSRLAEFTLAAPFAGYRLVAKYDLIAIESGKQVIIIDWKTNRKPIPRSTLIKRVQSRLYPFLLVQAGSLLNNGKKIQPEIIEMIYWFTADALAPVHLQYSEMDYKADLAFKNN